MDSDLERRVADLLSWQKISSQVDVFLEGSLEQADAFVRNMRKQKNAGSMDWTAAKTKRFGSGWKTAHSGEGWSVGRLVSDSIRAAPGELAGSEFDVILCTDGVLRAHLAAQAGSTCWQGYAPVPAGWLVECGVKDLGWDRRFDTLSLQQVLDRLSVANGLTTASVI